MQIIHLSHKEQVAYSQLCSLAWQSLVDEKELARIATLPDPDPRRWGALSEDGTLAAGLTCHDFRAFVQGEAVSQRRHRRRCHPSCVSQAGRHPRNLHRAFARNPLQRRDSFLAVSVFARVLPQIWL